MEPVAIFTSRADLPVIAARVSAPTYRDAAVLIQDLVADRTGCFADMAFYERVVPQVFARYQPAAGTPAEPGLIPGRLYCYQTQAALDWLLEKFALADGLTLEEAQTMGLLD